MRSAVVASSVAEVCRAAGLIAIAAGIWLIDRTRVFPGLWVLLPVGGTALLISPAASMGEPHDAFAAACRLIGLISYPLYLWHWPLLSFAHILRAAAAGVDPAGAARRQRHAGVGHLPGGRTADPIRLQRAHRCACARRRDDDRVLAQASSSIRPAA